MGRRRAQTDAKRAEGDEGDVRRCGEEMHAEMASRLLEHKSLEVAVIDPHSPHALRQQRPLEGGFIEACGRVAGELEDGAGGLEGDRARAAEAVRTALHDPRAVALGR